nr:ABC transporter permease [Propionibacterium sp.]
MSTHDDSTLLPPAGPPATSPGGDDARGRGEGVGEAKEVEGLSQGQIVWGRFIRHKGAIFGLVILISVALLSFVSMGIGPIKGLWKHQDYTRSGTVVDGGRPTLQLPFLPGGGFAIGDHPFGQDSIGSDSFAQVMKGVQTSLLVMVVLGLTALVIGVTIGAIAGYYRGKVDTVLMRFTDLIITLPVLVLGAVLGRLLDVLPVKLDATAAQREAIRSNMPLLLAVVLGMILWTGLARLTRSEFLSLREREFVDSARVAGASDWRIITKHILPNAVGVIIVNVTLLMSVAVTLEAALSFLNFGIKKPNVSLGLLIAENQGAFATRPWLFWWPGLFIILIALSVNFIGDGLRDAFDPRTRKIPSERTMKRAAAKLEAARRPEEETK